MCAERERKAPVTPVAIMFSTSGTPFLEPVSSRERARRETG
jgi:hypothetical protein